MSWVPIEKLCQLMTAPGLLVTVRLLPCVEKVACPRVTVGPVGFAYASSPAKHAATANASSLRFHAQSDLRRPTFIRSPETVALRSPGRSTHYPANSTIKTLTHTGLMQHPLSKSRSLTRRQIVDREAKITPIPGDSQAQWEEPD